MNLNEKRITEIFLGLILIIGLIILIAVFTKPNTTAQQANSQNQIPQSIINSYNTNSFNRIIYKNSETSRRKTLTYKKADFSDDKIRFSSKSKNEKIRGILGNEIAKYTVYVKNRGNEGRYFEVKFSLEDCYGDEETDSMTKYIYPGDEEKFVYTDIKDKYCDWDYEAK